MTVDSAASAPLGGRWWTDPVVWAGTAFAALAHGAVFFAGEYLPYIDWPIHVGLIAVFAHGEAPGALSYLERSWAPNPYLLFYLLSAGFAQVLPVVAAAKLALTLASAALVPAVAALLDAHGRDPRLALVAPMATFGYALGYGFVSFCFTLPFLFWSLAELERLLLAVDGDEKKSWRVARLGLALSLAYLGHALIFIGTMLVLALRALVFFSLRPARAREALLALGPAMLPALILAGIRLLILVAGPARTTETTPATRGGPWLDFPKWEERWNPLRYYLLDRGSFEHLHSMYAVAALFALTVVISILRRRQVRRLPGGYLAVAIGVTGLFLLGPSSILRPFNVWLFYQRFATAAAVAIFGLSRVDLRGRAGLVLSLGMLGTVGYDAHLQAGHVRRVSEVGRRYDPIRSIIPPGSRVLGLTYGLPRTDLAMSHAVHRTLYFYHLADGAAYTAYLFDNPLIPVRFRDDVERPAAPFWRTLYRFDPETHGRAFDYLVLRGQPVEKARASRHHRLVAEVDGWFVFETVPHPPWPGG